MDNLNEEEKGGNIGHNLQIFISIYFWGEKLGHTNVTHYSIELTDNIVINSKYQKYPKIHMNEIKKQTKDLLVNESISNSSSP